MKKNVALLLSGLLLTAVVFYACKKDKRDINLNVSAVTNFFTPADNKYIKLNPAAGTTETFEWDQALAEDGSLVLYEVAFDQENGDFSKPFYTIPSNSGGVQNKLTLTHGQLSQIAALGGSDFFQRKKFKWTVFSTKGTNSVKASVSRVIDLERPGGFAVIPGNVYITGSASEGGTNLAQALKMQRVSAGVFEIFCKLKAGTFKFVDGNTGTPREFFLRDNAGITELAVAAGGSTTFTGPDKTVRIIINFNDVNGSMVEVKSIQMWYSEANAFKTTLNYVSNGEWRSTGYIADWIPVSWSPLGEDRYKYKMVYNDGTGDKDLWLNSSGIDATQTVYPSTPEYRRVDLVRNNGTRDQYVWKMVMTEVPIGSKVDFIVTLRGSDPFYTQNYVRVP